MFSHSLSELSVVSLSFLLGIILFIRPHGRSVPLAFNLAELGIFLLAIGLVLIVCLIRWRELNIRKRDFGSICQLIGEFRDNTHNTAYHTWSANRLDGRLNETIGAIVTGLKGHGMAGQAEGNKLKGEEWRGDYKSPLRVFLEKHLTNERLHKIEFRLKKLPILWRLARDIDCKSADRVYPGVEFRMQGTVRRFNGAQYIHIHADEMNENLSNQWNFPPIFEAIQAFPSSVQELERRNDTWYAEDNFGITAGIPIIDVTDNGIRKWIKGRKEWSAPSWRLTLDLAKTIIDEANMRGRNLRVGDLEAHANGNNQIDLTNNRLFRKLVAGGEIDHAFHVTTYGATNAAIAAIELAGGTVNVIESGEKQFVIDNNLQPRFQDLGHYIAMNEEIDIEDDATFTFRLQSERPRPNWASTLQTLDQMLQHGILLVYHHRDVLARECISVMMVRPTRKERKKIIKKIEKAKSIDKSSQKKIQFNWYLFDDNKRKEYSNSRYSFKDCGTMLLAQAVRNGEGDFEILHWSPKAKRKNDITKRKIRDLLTGAHEGVSEAPIYPRGYDLEYSNQEMRRERAQWFFENCILNFYRNWWDYAVITNTARNIGFGSLAEEMVRLYYGFRGSRREKGQDTYEYLDGEWVGNEVKTISGSKGDYMGNKHPRGNMQLGEDLEKILSWNGFFFVRTEDQCQQIDGSTRGNLKMALMAPNHRTMMDLHRRTLGFYTRNPKSPGKLQYDAPRNENAFDLDYVVGSASSNELLYFVRCVEFIEHPEEGQTTMNILNQRPNMNNCTCEICDLGGLRWVPERGNLSERAWRNRRMIACNGEFWNI